jgi:molybdate transport system substrate-binding protein
MDARSLGLAWRSETGKVNRVKIFQLCLGLAAMTAATLGAKPVELNVFAAASLSDALREIAPKYKAATGVTLRLNLGASGMLARQIQEGAPADVFISADVARLEQLERAGVLMPGTRVDLLRNTMVLVVAKEAGAEIHAFSDLANATIRRVVIGEPATVPAGTYAKAYLEKLGLWSALQKKIVPLENVRAVLAAVESGNADAGFVYKTDALISNQVHVAIEVSLADGPKITYPVAIVNETKSPEAARQLLKYLSGAEAQAVFLRYGFLP